MAARTRRRTPAPEPAARRRPLVAAAAPVDITSAAELKRLVKRRQTWQPEGWAYAEAIGNIGDTLDYRANVISKVRPFAAYKPAETDADPIPVAAAAAEGLIPEPLAALADAIMAELDNGDGVPAILHKLSWNTDVPGDCHVVGEDRGNGEEWRVYSLEELFETGGRPYVRLEEGDKKGRPLEGSPLTYRQWLHHPRWRDQARSPMMPLVLEGICEELLLLGRERRSNSKSRLSKGVVLLSDSVLLPKATSADGDTAMLEEAEGDPAQQELIDAMLAPLAGDGSASEVVPVVWRVQGDQIETAMKHISFGQLLDPQTLDWAKYLLERIAQGLPMPKEITLGMGDINHWGCADESTEILTAEGWVAHDRLEPGDVILTLNHDTGLSEWQPVTHVNRYDVADAEMLSIENRTHSSLTTLNHRWPTLHRRRPGEWDRAWRTSETLNTSDRLLVAAPCADLPAEAKWSDAFVELVAWFFTEGTCRYVKRSPHLPPQVLIGQSHKANPENVARIRRALTALYGPEHEGRIPSGARPTWRAFVEDRGMTVFSLNKAAAEPLLSAAPDRVVALDFVRDLSAAQLELFLSVAALADGRRNAVGGSMIGQRCADRLAAVELAGILAGRTVRRWCQQSSGFVAGPQWQQSIYAPSHEGTVSIGNTRHEVVRYTGTVWCPSVANGTWLARRKGTVWFTGNSHQIERAAFRAYMEPAVIGFVHGFTVGFLRPKLKASGIDLEALRRLCVWYDPSEALAPEDKKELATRGVELGLIGDAAWRREADFDEEDAPTDEERLMRLGTQRSIMTADLSLEVLKIAGLLAQGVTLGPEQPAVGPAPAPRAEEPEPDSQDTPADDTPPSGAIVASSTPVSDVGDRLAAIDRRLFDQCATACDMAVEAAVNRAGSKLRSLANRDPKAKRAVAKATNADVARTLGRPWAVRLAAASEDDDEAIAALLGGAFASLVERVERLVERAQQATVAEALAVALPEDRPSDGELAVLAAEQADDRDRATVALVAALTALTVSVLFDGAPAEEPGEFDPTVLVPAAVVREALAVAGGAVNVERTAAGGLSVDGRPVGGVATGERSRTLFARVRAWWTGYRWEYGDASSRQRPFEPHRRLDGRTFSTWDSDELNNTETTWLGELRYRPSDHRGCRCSFVPIVVEPVASEKVA